MPAKGPHTHDIGRLHVITDQASTALAALEAGAPVVQVRDKSRGDREVYEMVAKVLARAEALGARVVVNDRLHVALAAGAHGAHLGAEDLPVAVARRMLGPGALIGGTARDPQTAVALQSEGASYLGVGPVYPSSTKVGLPRPLGAEGLSRVAEAVEIPVIAISGVTAARVSELLDAGAHGVAVVAAVSMSAHPAAAVTELLEALDKAGRS